MFVVFFCYFLFAFFFLLYCLSIGFPQTFHYICLHPFILIGDIVIHSFHVKIQLIFSRYISRHCKCRALFHWRTAGTLNSGESRPISCMPWCRCALSVTVLVVLLLSSGVTSESSFVAPTLFFCQKRKDFKIVSTARRMFCSLKA